MRSFRCLFSVFLLACRFSLFTKAQEAPLFTFEKFDESVDFRTNVCERQRELYADNISLSDALNGLSLSVVLTNYQTPSDIPFFSLTNESTIDAASPGLFAIILDELAKRAGFTWRNSYGTVLPIDPSTDGNKTWSDLLEWEVETFDISAGKWDQSIARMKREIAFAEGWYDSSMILVHVEDASNQTSLDIWSFLMPFQWSVWGVIAITILGTGLAYYWMERRDNATDTRQLEKHPGEAMFYTAITFTGHFEFRPRTPSAMILTFSTTFIALIIAAVYTANLASFLVARRTPTFNIESVAQAVSMHAPICVRSRVNIDDYITEKYPDAVLIRKETEKDVHLALKRGECEVAVVPVSQYDQFSRSRAANGDCSLQWSGRTENIVPAGFASRVDSGVLCTSLISHAMDLHMKEMKADGFLEREWNAFLQRTGDHNCVERVESSSSSSNEEDIYSLGVKDMAGIFIIHAILLGVAILIAFFRPYCQKASSEVQRQISNSQMASSVFLSRTNKERDEAEADESQPANGEAESGETHRSSASSD